MSFGIGKLFEDAESFADQRRLLPAVQSLEEARRLTQIPDRRAWASYNLGVIFWHHLGNGLAARREFLAAITDFDMHGYGQRPNLKIVHANALENAMLCSLSFDEFENLAEELHVLTPRVPILIGLVPEVRNWRERGDSWSDRLFVLAGTYYNRNDARQDVGRYGEARSTYHLILTHRRELRVSREDWRMALFELCALSMRMASDCVKTRGGDDDLNSPEEFLPILTEAIPLADEYLRLNSGDDDLKKVCADMEQMVDNCRQRWMFLNRGRSASERTLLSEIAKASPIFPEETYEQSPVRQYSENLSHLINLLVFILFWPPLVVAFAFSTPACFFSFIAASIIPFFSGKSRRMRDPVAGIFEVTSLSPNDFHKWAKFVCASNQYEQLYFRYVLDAKKGVDKKLPITFSQIKAINYIHAWKIILVLLIPLNVFCLYDLFWSNLSFHSPLLIGAAIGVLWGYSLGVYVLWRTCRRYKSPGDLPI